MKIGYLRNDDDCHWYLIPEEDVESFDALMKESYQVSSDSDRFYEICELIDQFPRVDGYGSLKVIIED